MKTTLDGVGYDSVPEVLPVIPTMDVVVFPHIIVPLLVLDEKIITGINQSLEQSKTALLLAAKNTLDTNGAIGTDDLYTMGTVASIMRVIKIPEGGIKILVQGIYKARAIEIIAQIDSLYAKIEKIAEKEVEAQVLQEPIAHIKYIAEHMASSGSSFSPDFHIILSKMQEPDKIADFVLSHLTLTVQQAQALLELDNQKDFIEQLCRHLRQEIDATEIQEKIRASARESMNEAQKEYYLREQLKAIKRELGDDEAEEMEAMREKLQILPLPDATRKEISRQISRLERTAAESLEAVVTRNYLEWIFSLPWGIQSEDNLDIVRAREILDEDHYGLEKIKDKILDFISIRKLKQDGFTPILCFIGPPGTGKTSLGKSIARSLGRAYIRISLGGVKDEAEIRGHRRTYVGAMPGRFIQAIRKAGSCNPLIVIDELDKIGSDFRGDPSAAMLEVLDPQQNQSFYDNYLGIPFDLSKVIFVATANDLTTISGPLRDRMEVIEVSGYSLEEKRSIAKKHLIKKAIADTGLSQEQVTFSDDLIDDIIVSYTRESGVRQLDRLIHTICAKIARNLVEKDTLVSITPDTIELHLGARIFLSDLHDHINQIGISNGLAWTSCGGEILKIEAVLMPGKGKLLLTGQLGEIMKESAQAALSYARAHAKDFGINPSLFTTQDLHIHLPAGAVPKDGPSAGISLLTAILSALTDRPINAHYAMTGELNLRGEIMPIGGVKEKILAAKRNNMTHIILPNKNKKDLLGIEDAVQGIDIVFVDHANEVLERVLLPNSTRKMRRT
ncbi:MAG TPA: endopeptidase La [Candidatus Babeliales bacterium]|jgi:ATP-dependent Lon protease|nr:endopeptidase La [Candidatus Babeliales bacterium]